MLKRADVILVESGLAPGRERAKALIMEGVVYSKEVKVTKASDQFPEDTVLTVREDPIPFVSRGGLKLDKAIKKYGIDLTGAVCIDVGASTGGFTDCMLQNGAAHVYSVDVGYGQLDWRLRNDPRVTCMERRNAREMEPSWFEKEIDFASCDVSFISIRLIMPRMYDCLKKHGRAVVLVKPQFEAGRGKVGKNGVVREESTHLSVLESCAEFAVESGFSILALDHSPIKGPKGNIEYLMYLEKTDEPNGFDIKSQAHDVVSLSHAELM